jgi:hypothetical protein
VNFGPQSTDVCSPRPDPGETPEGARRFVLAQQLGFVVLARAEFVLGFEGACVRRSIVTSQVHAQVGNSRGIYLFLENVLDDMFDIRDSRLLFFILSSELSTMSL